MSRYLEGAEALEGATDATIVVLPLGAHENHGPHLPPETDTLIATGLARRLARAVPPEVDLRILPAEAVGYSPEHTSFPGTLTLPAAELIERWVGIGRALHERGCRRLLLLNAHGGNVPVAQIVAQELRLLPMLAVATKWDRFLRTSDLVPERERALGIHGGLIETSVMLELHPHLVDMEAAQDFPSRQEEFATTFRHLLAYGPHAFGWMAEDLNPVGAMGDAASATAILGERLTVLSIGGLAGVVEDMGRFELALFAPRHDLSGAST